MIEIGSQCPRFDTGDTGSDGEVLFLYEHNDVIRGTIERVRHFEGVRSAVGLVCKATIGIKYDPLISMMAQV